MRDRHSDLPAYRARILTARGLFRRIPRWVKVAVGVVLLVVVAVAILLVTLVVLLLIRLLSGGSLPADLQTIQSWVESNLQPFLNIWQTFEGLGGG